jgi:uncharacterized protein (TIGR02996 family)
MTTKHLKQAQKQLAADDEERALATLLEAWRKSRAPRVADLIDLLSARVARRREPIRGKTVTARTQKWKTISAEHDPADVERLLAMLWPPRWQAALDLLEPLGEWPDDPRIAMGLLGSLAEDRYNTWTSYRFYEPLAQQMQRICDARTLEPLKKWVAQEHPHYVEHYAKPRVREAITAMEKALPGYPALDADGEAICSELEQALGAGALARAEEQQAALLAEVYENPDDLTCRQVYADFLSELGDPLGEFITLQLAPERDAKGRRREGALLKAHRREWLGPLARRVVEKSVVFRGGYPAEVTLERLSGKLARDLSHPAWSTVKVVTIEHGYWSDDLPAGFFKLPWVQALDGIYNLNSEHLAQMSGASLTHLGISGDIGGDKVRATLEKKEAFSKLRVLGVSGVTPEQVEPLAKMPLLKRIERLLLVPHDRDQLKALIGKLDSLPRSIQEVWLLAGYRINMRDPEGWHTIFRRDDRGKLGRMTLAWGGGPFRTYFMPLKQVPRKAVSSVTLELPRREWSQREIQTIEKACSHLQGLGIELPWSDAPEPRTLEPRGPCVSMSLFGEEVIGKENLEWLWSWLRDKRSPLGYVHDSFRVNSGVHRSLGADPLARITKWIKPSTRWLELYCDGQEELRRLHLGGYSCLGLDTDGFSEEGFAARYLDWLMPLLDRISMERGEVSFAGEQQLTDAEGEEMPSPLSGLHEAPGLQDWVSIFGEATRAVITPEDLDRAAEAGGGMARVRHGKRCSLVVLGDSPLTSQRDLLKEEGVVAFQREVQRRFRKNFAARIGYDFIERVEKVIAPAAEAIGLEPWPDQEGAIPTIRFGAQRKKRRFWIHVQLSDFLEEPTLGAGMHDGKDWSWRGFDSGGRRYNFPATDREILDTSLKRIADQLPTRTAEYMEECLSGKKGSN